jgi:hypothetical protein
VYVLHAFQKKSPTGNAEMTMGTRSTVGRRTNGQNRSLVALDIVLLAAPETSWPAHFRAEFERLAARLAAHRIAVKPWLLSWEYPKVVPEL